MSPGPEAAIQMRRSLLTGRKPMIALPGSPQSRSRAMIARRN